MMERTVFKTKTSIFEGPLDLLLDLIEKRKLSISDLSLSQVTDEFLEYIKQHNNFPMGEIAEFIVVASTLVLIKSKSLLPILDLTEQEEESIDDLQRRLKEYKKIKELSAYIRDMFGHQIIFGRGGKLIEPIFSPGTEISLDSVVGAVRSVIKQFPIPERLPSKIVKKVMSLEETIENLINRVKVGLRMSFNEFHAGQKESIIVSFLAVLELIKRGMVVVNQENSFGNINIENAEYKS